MATFGKLQLASTLDALIAMGAETSPERRRELMRGATDVFFAPTRPPPEVLNLFDAALDRMTDQLEVELRADLAKRLAPMTDAPRRLLARLMGDPEGWVAVVKPGRVMFELAGVPEPLAREAMRLAGHKLPVKTKFITREDGFTG